MKGWGRGAGITGKESAAVLQLASWRTAGGLSVGRLCQIRVELPSREGQGRFDGPGAGGDAERAGEVRRLPPGLVGTPLRFPVTEYLVLLHKVPQYHRMGHQHGTSSPGELDTDVPPTADN